MPLVNGQPTSCGDCSGSEPECRCAPLGVDDDGSALTLAMRQKWRADKKREGFEHRFRVTLGALRCAGIDPRELRAMMFAEWPA